MITPATLTVLRATRNRYGDRGTAVSHTVDGCVVVPASSTEQYGSGTDQVSTTLTVIARQGADVTAQDVVEVPGYPGQFQVVGDPLRYPVSPGSYGVELRLTRISG